MAIIVKTYILSAYVSRFTMFDLKGAREMLSYGNIKIIVLIALGIML